MSKLKTSLTLGLALAVSACASTSNYTPQPLTLQSHDVFEFDDSKSFALNVAEMTNKTRGLRDVKVPENAQHRISGAEKGLAAYAGIFGGGLNMLGMGLLYSEVIGARNWRPMYVFTDLDADLAESENLTSKVERLIDSKMGEAFLSDRLDGYNYVGLAHTHRRQESNYNVFVSGPGCVEQLAKIDNDTGLPSWFGDYGVFGAIEFSEVTCNVPFRVSVERIVHTDDEERLVVVMEQIGTFDLVSDIASSINGFGVVPERYLDLDGTQYSHIMPYVTYDGYVHVFSKDLKPVPTQSAH